MFFVTCFPSNTLDFTNQNIITKKGSLGKKTETVINVTKHPSNFPISKVQNYQNFFREGQIYKVS